MKNLDGIQSEVLNKTKKIQRELKELFGLYRDFQSEIENRFREELRDQGGKIEGLEDFHSFSLTLKRNMQNIGNSASIMARIKDVSGYNIEEELQEPKAKIEKKVKELILETVFEDKV